MKTRANAFQLVVVLIASFCFPLAGFAQTIPGGSAIGAEVNKIMTATHANGMAVAVIDHGKVGYVHAYGIRDAKGDPLTTDKGMAAQSARVVIGSGLRCRRDYEKLDS